MEQRLPFIYRLPCLILILLVTYNHNVSANVEVKALTAFKDGLIDPDGKLSGWDSTLVNPCSWPHVKCVNDESVIRLNLGSFKLTGQLVPELGQLSKLKELALYNNNINGTIPPELGKLTNLNHLDLSSNNLTGPIPNAIGNLRLLEKMKLSHNSLSGEIPRSLTAISSLNTLDLSFNQLTGDVPVNGSFSKFTKSSFSGNPELNMAALSSPPSQSPGRNISVGAIAGGVAAGIVLLIAASVLGFTLWRRRMRQDDSIELPDEEYQDFQPGQLKKFSFQELKIATDNFNKHNFIGRGGFANVYKGCLSDGTFVAIKRLKTECAAQGGEAQFQTEVEMISMAIHRNLIRLHGYCTTPVERLLVYPLMSNGSVAACLRERTATQAPLSWEVRKRIALGVARGLAYLHEHCEPRIIHRDVKTDNIFLDEEYEAVVGDFGLAKLLDYKHTHVITRVCGTVGHIAPEYFTTGKSSEKTDVFGYGAMLLEVITAQRASHLVPPANQPDITWLEWVIGILKDSKMEPLVDPDLKGNYIEAEVEHLVKIALLCRQYSPIERPKMSDVVRMLEGDDLTERWAKWEKEEKLNRKISRHIHPSNYVQIFDSTSDLSAEELSAAR